MPDSRAGKVGIETLLIESAEGASSEIRVVGEPENASAVIVCFPAMGVKAEKYDVLASSLHRAGLAVVIAELRGHGSSSVRASRTQDFGYHTMLENDFPAVLHKAKELFPNVPCYLLGHSLGGQLASLYLAAYPGVAEGLILTASCTVYYRGWKFPKNLSILLFSQFSALIATLLGHFPGRKIGFAGREASSVMRDWARNCRTGIYRLSDSTVDFEAALAKLDCTLIAIRFSDDQFAPKQATRNLLQKFKASKARQFTLDANDLGCSKADHFSWLKHPQAVTGAIVLALADRPQHH
ncbi:MAG: alpha/beta fold hydrolase [Gammaproteobacteria bacterium]|nr:alpha/beta fold hydrolase [Gammaproteobacteria bacterium]